MDQPTTDQPSSQPSAPAPAVSAKPNNAKAYLIGGIIVVCAGIAITVLPRGTATPSGSPAGTAASTATYKDGTYSADGDYMTHVGSEQVHVTVTLKDGIITDSQFSATPNAMMSARYQDMFAANYKPLVIGKNIDDVELGKVSGSSLTPIGFNNALAKIKAQAVSGS